MATTVLQTKLYVPPTRPDLVPRPQLIDKLNQGVQRKLTLVSAAAGYGKSTLLAAWVQQLEHPVSWISLDEGDDLPERFFVYLAAAVQQNGISWQSTDEEGLDGLMNAIAGSPSPLVLVLDDYHLISAPAIHDAISFFLDFAPPTFHLVLSSRIDPPLPLSRHFSRGEVNEIRTLDLLFNEADTAIFLNQSNDLALSAGQIKALADRTEGWATGLQLAALSLRRLTPTERQNFTAVFAGDDRYILDYLISEVLQQQSSGRHEFLLLTSCLTELSAELCGAVTGMSTTAAQDMLAGLEQDNLFLISLDSRRRWYRYHHLFADVLHGKLKATAGDTVAELHRRAARWYVTQSRIEAAMQHSLAAEDFDMVAKLLETPDLLSHALPDQILRWLDQLPPEILLAYPKLAIRQLWVLLNNNELDVVEAKIDALATAIESDPQLRLESLVIRTQLAHRQQEYANAIALGEELLSLLPPQQSPEMLALKLGGLFGLGEAYLLAGDLVPAYERFTETIRVSELAGNEVFQMRGRLMVTRVLIAQGNIAAAKPMLETLLTELPAAHSKEKEMAHGLLEQIRSMQSTAVEPLAAGLAESLTARELDVLRLLDSDLPNSEIGNQLFISTNTVKTHLKRLYGKLGARSRFEAVAKAKERNIL